MKRKVHKKSADSHNEREKPRFCDPAACHHCEYVGEGDFVCAMDARDPIGVLVVSDWEATEKYLHCKRHNHRRRERK